MTWLPRFTRRDGVVLGIFGLAASRQPSLAMILVIFLFLCFCYAVGRFAWCLVAGATKRGVK